MKIILILGEELTKSEQHFGVSQWNDKSSDKNDWLID